MIGGLFDKHALNMKSWFWERRHSRKARKVKFGQRSKVKSKQASVGVPFVITYHSKLKL